jgi:U3 small nucleolar RNA-associated protein 19
MNLYRHLPGYLVAAFAKRLSRLCLSAPPAALTVVIPFIFNLIRRHANLSVLIHHADASSQGQWVHSWTAFIAFLFSQMSPAIHS